MPSLTITTNVKVTDQKAFVLAFSRLAAETLRKPETYISVSYNYDEFLTFAGSVEPAFLMTIVSLDNINPELNDQYSKVFFDHFNEKLGVQGNRGYITYIDPGRAYLGHKGTTFATIFGK